MKRQQRASSRKAPRRNRSLTLLITLLAVVILTGYCYRDTLYAYWDADVPPVDAPVEEPPSGTPADTEPPAAEEPPPVEKTSVYPPAPGEILQLANGNDLLALVTKETSLGQYKPTDLVTVPAEMRLYDVEYQLRAEAYQQLRAMWEDAGAAGVDFFVNSAYRSYATQKRLFNNYAAKHGEAEANKFSARPGQSEHQLGTTVDVGIAGHVLTNSFGGTTPGRWLVENAHRYGFVLSYPKNSSEITGYIYEPWHFRYIGVDMAAAWRESGQILCQYLAQQPQQWQ
ncbi:MAG TPA: M15 family metallopeptidase [Oscillospiraceae bacterium]|nr:M15 family metallopeptidase [Oscillospiraceae bacterium]